MTVSQIYFRKYLLTINSTHFSGKEDTRTINTNILLLTDTVKIIFFYGFWTMFSVKKIRLMKVEPSLGATFAE